MIYAFLSLLMFFPGGSDQFKSNLENLLKQRLSEYESFKFEIVNMPGNFESITIAEDDFLRINNEMAYVTVDLKNLSGSISRSYITLKLKLYKKVFVAKKNIERRTNLTEKDFEVKTVDVASLRGTALNTDSSVTYFRTKGYVKKGEILIEEMLENIPLVFVGDRLTANSVSGSVVVSVDAVARQEGCPDEIIRIMTIDKKQFKAKIVDKQNVIIVE